MSLLPQRDQTLFKQSSLFTSSFWLPTVNSKTKTTIHAKMIWAPIWGEVLLAPQKADKARDCVLQNFCIYLYLSLQRDGNQSSWMVYYMQDKGETGFWLADSCLSISIRQGLTWLDSAISKTLSVFLLPQFTWCLDSQPGLYQVEEALWGASCIPRPWLLIKEKQWWAAWGSVVECKKRKN